MKRFVISISVVLLLLSFGFNADVAWSQAKKDLNQAAVDGDLDRVKTLVAEGQNVNAVNRMGMTPLVVAAMNDRTAVCEFLVEKGADVNAKDGRGQTALYFAVDRNNMQLVELLVKKGADVNATTGRGENAFSLAKTKRNADGNTEIVDFLAKNGATDPVVQDLYGDSYYGDEGMAPGGRGGMPRAAVTGSIAPAAVQVDLLADPNEIKARVKTFEGLEKAIQDVSAKSSSEQRYWEQTRYDNRTSVARAAQKQVEDELALVKKVAVEEKAKKTTEAIDALVAKKQDRHKKVSRELLEQRRETMASQSSRGGGRSRGSARSSGRGYSSGSAAGGGAESALYGDAGGPGMPATGRYGRSSARAEEPLDRETEEEIRRWLQATLDNKPDLAKSTHEQVYTELALIRVVAVEEEAKKTTAAIDGVLLARQERFDAYIKKVEEEKNELAPGQDPRTAGDPRLQQGVRSRGGRTGRGAVGGTQQQNVQTGRGRRR